MTEFVAESLKDYRSFKPIYNDFRVHAVTDYGFELEPLSFEDFIDSIEKDLIKCIVLKENGIPTAFLIYTTMISEAIELNIIHCMNKEHFINHSKYLIEEFLNETNNLRKKKIVCYPMLGNQKLLMDNLIQYGFKFVWIVVLRFLMSGTNSLEILKNNELKDLPENYKIIPWNQRYFNQAVNIVHEAFETTFDALFDPRFKTLNGTYDILTKITKNIYAQFLPEATSVLMYEDKPIGFCFMNLTNGQFANIPIVAIKKDFQGKGLSKLMLRFSLDKIVELIKSAKYPIKEVNTCTETNNYPALKMYRALGFKEDYNYPQSYLPILKK